MINPYFPVDMTAMAANRYFYELGEQSINVNGAIIQSAPLNHPGECVAYRVDADGASFVYATDNEPGSPYHDRALRNLARGADVIVYDAQYSPEQLQGDKKGWGHSSWLEGTQIAQECGIKRLILFHHDPDNDDAYIDGFVERAQQEFRNTSGASEGMEILLPQEADARLRLVSDTNRREEHRYHIELPVRITWQEADGTRRETFGLTRDISKSGIYVIAPTDTPLEQPLAMSVVLPDEITHRGETRLGYIARTVRHEQRNGDLGTHHSSIGLGARVEASQEIAAE